MNLIPGWLMLAAGDRRQRAGNDGYDDHPTYQYSWDSAVPNHAAVMPGHAIAVWDGTALIGASVIERSETSESDKWVFRCPLCSRADIKRRATRHPAYRCQKCGGEFDQPHEERTPVRTYRSRHGIGWQALEGVLTGEQLRGLCTRPRSQLSLRQLRWDDFHHAVTAAGGSLHTVDSTERFIREGHGMGLARVGQGAFRRDLLDRYGAVCAMSGAAPAEALEAAHLYSYATSGRHHEHGGLLLRRDLHRLFDSGLLAVNPTTKRLDVSDALTGFPAYGYLHGQGLQIDLKPDHWRWIGLHWRPTVRVGRNHGVVDGL